MGISDGEVFMNWVRHYQWRVFLRSSLCVSPIICMAVALIAAPLIRLVDDSTRWTLLGFGPDGARVVIGALASSLLTFIVFAFSIILLAVQIAGGQLTPRIIARIIESRLAKLTLSGFVFSFTYTLAALGRIEGRVPQMPVLVAVLSSLFSIVLFLYLIQKVSQGLRPVTILTRVGMDTCNVIRSVYPNPFIANMEKCLNPAFNKSPARTILHCGHSGVFLAFDKEGMVETARRVDCMIELVPQIGDFLATGEGTFRLYGADANNISDGSLRNSVAVGPERLLEQDPAFGLRILVDIAIKALSPAINDPTTAVLSLDQIHRLLHLLGGRQLDTGIAQDSSGLVRLVYRTPCWEDYVTLAVTEIRLCGAESPQVTRRLQAMFEQLVQVLPLERAETIRKEMALLQRTIQREFADSEDRILAGVADLQGFGSPQ